MTPPEMVTPKAVCRCTSRGSPPESIGPNSLRLHPRVPPGRHPLEEIMERRDAALDAVALLDRPARGNAQRGEARRIGQNLQGSCGQAVDVEERLEKTVHPAFDELAHGWNIRSQDRHAGGHRVEERPGDHERGREVDVQVAQPEDVGQVLGKDATRKPEAGEVVITLAQNPLLEARRTSMQLVPAVMDLLAA